MRLFLHAKPVSLCTLESVLKLKAVQLQQVKEGIAHHIRYAVLSLQQTPAKPTLQNTDMLAHIMSQ